MKGVSKTRSPSYVLGKMEVPKQRDGKYKGCEFTWEVHL